MSALHAIKVERVFEAHGSVGQSERCFPAVLADVRHNYRILEVEELVPSDNDLVLPANRLHPNPIIKSVIGRIYFSAVTVSQFFHVFSVGSRLCGQVVFLGFELAER